MVLGIFWKDSKTGKPSSSKFWETVGYTVITIDYLQNAGDHGWEETAAYGALVAGNKLFSYWLKRRYEKPVDGNNDMDNSEPQTHSRRHRSGVDGGQLSGGQASATPVGQNQAD